MMGLQKPGSNDEEATKLSSTPVGTSDSKIQDPAVTLHNDTHLKSDVGGGRDALHHKLGFGPDDAFPGDEGKKLMEGGASKYIEYINLETDFTFSTGGYVPINDLTFAVPDGIVGKKYSLKVYFSLHVDLGGDHLRLNIGGSGFDWFGGGLPVAEPVIPIILEEYRNISWEFFFETISDTFVEVIPQGLLTSGGEVTFLGNFDSGPGSYAVLQEL